MAAAPVFAALHTDHAPADQAEAAMAARVAQAAEQLGAAGRSLA